MGGNKYAFATHAGYMLAIQLFEKGENRQITDIRMSKYLI